jgi:hypothetical protein
MIKMTRLVLTNLIAPTIVTNPRISNLRKGKNYAPKFHLSSYASCVAT